MHAYFRMFLPPSGNSIGSDQPHRNTHPKPKAAFFSQTSLFDYEIDLDNSKRAVSTEVNAMVSEKKLQSEKQASPSSFRWYLEIPKGVSAMLSSIKSRIYLASQEDSLPQVTPTSSVKRSVLAMSMRFTYDANPPSFAQNGPARN